MIVNPCEDVADGCVNWFLLEDFGLCCPIWGRARLPLKIGSSGNQPPVGLPGLFKFGPHRAKEEGSSNPCFQGPLS